MTRNEHHTKDVIVEANSLDDAQDKALFDHNNKWDHTTIHDGCTETLDVRRISPDATPTPIN